MMTSTEAQLRIWGWAVSDHDDLAMFTSELPAWGVDHGWWDRDAAWLSRQQVAHGDEPYHRPPEHWCLPGVIDLRIMHDTAFWDTVRTGGLLS